MCRGCGNDVDRLFNPACYRTVLQRQEWLVAHRWAHIAVVMLCDALLLLYYAALFVAALGLAYLVLTALGVGFVWLMDTDNGKQAARPGAIWGLSWLMGILVAFVGGILLFFLISATCGCYECVTSPGYTHPLLAATEPAPGDVSVRLDDDQ